MRNETACMSSPLIDSASFPRWGQSHTSWRVKMDLIHMHRLLNTSVILVVCVCVCVCVLLPQRRPAEPLSSFWR